MARCQRRPLSLDSGSGHRRQPSRSAIPAIPFGLSSQPLEKPIFYHAGRPETVGHDHFADLRGCRVMIPLAKATSCSSRGIVRRSTSTPFTSAIHTSGLLQIRWERPFRVKCPVRSFSMLRSRCIGPPRRLTATLRKGKWVFEDKSPGERFGRNGEPVEAYQTTMDVAGANLDSLWS